jgi:hypothetical protein
MTALDGLMPLLVSAAAAVVAGRVVVWQTRRRQR